MRLRCPTHPRKPQLASLIFCEGFSQHSPLRSLQSNRHNYISCCSLHRKMLPCRKLPIVSMVWHA